MHRSPWELAAHVRYQTAYLAAERQRCSPPAGDDGQPTTPLTRLRYATGLGLIRAGRALAGHQAVRALSTSAPRPATTAGPGS